MKLSEAFAVAAAENRALLMPYMMAGIPVVASDFEEMGRVVRDEGIGEVCNPDDPADIARAVITILEAPNGGAVYREAAARAIDRYTWERERQVLLDVYGRLA